MTQEEKAKAYDEALERARKVHRNYKNLFPEDSYSEDIEEIFPELRESEDERIRKWLFELVQNTDTNHNNMKLSENCKLALTWLEKQKKQKPNIELIQRSWYMEGYHDREFGKEPKWIVKTGEGGPKHELNPRYGEYIEKEQKPAWSEEDEIKLEDVINDLETLKDWIRKHDTGWKNNPGLTLIDKRISWLKSLRPDTFQNGNSHWKPSEEQMEALQRAIDACESEWAYQDDELRSLLNELKKL